MLDHLLFDPDVFLRSINLCFDSAEPERIAHYRPTSKSIPLIRGLLSMTKERAFLVVAPYGSGKSLNFTYILNVIENRPEAQDVLYDIEERIHKISPDLGKTISSIRVKKKQGLVLSLHGYISQLPKALKEAALEALRRNKLNKQIKQIEDLHVKTIDDVIVLFKILKKICNKTKRDKLCILWDETGRHLETLISSGQSSELSDIQVLAEYVSRSSDIPITLGLSLHQSMFHYAQQMNQSVRAEWLKISGRFETIQYVDDSKETYRLISEIIESGRSEVSQIPQKIIENRASLLIEKNGFFASFTIDELREILEKTYPIDPVVIYLLPRISARVAQNERTLFTFLYNINLNENIDVSVLYDYFSQSMRADTSVGGTHRQWLETESAILKTDGNEECIQALKTTCLLSLGVKGERNRIGRETLVDTMKGYKSNIDWDKIVLNLIEKKLLLYRVHSQEISIWHGTDIDLRGRLSDEIDRHRGSFSIIDFLNHEEQPEAWKSIEYNTDYGVTRYWIGEYHIAANLQDLSDFESFFNIPLGCDGKILYLVTESEDEINKAREIASHIKTIPQIVFAIPSSPIRLKEAALEVWCLSQMQNNVDLISEDPLILPEIQQMIDDARLNLHNILARLIKPHVEGPHWFNNGVDLNIAGTSQLRRELSRIIEEVFPYTPKIHNELINRHKPSGTIVNSRKKLMMGILERHGTNDLGLKGTTPDASMFRTILCITGLYKETSPGRWDYSSGKTQSLINDPGLKKVWGIIRDFFERSSENSAKSPQELIRKLQLPPFGIRNGLIPIFFATGLKAFGKAISLRYKNEYVDDIMPSIIEDICRNPQYYELEVVRLDESKELYLNTIRILFQGAQAYSPDTDLIRSAYDAIQSWIFQLPKASLTAESVTDHAKSLQCILQKLNTSDPIDLLFTQLPLKCQYNWNDIEDVKYKIISLKSELENVSHTYVRKACDSIYRALSRSQTENIIGIQNLAKQWANYFPDEVVSHSLPSIAKGLLSRMKMFYKNEKLFVNSMSLLLVGKSVDDWDDSAAIEFENKIQELTNKIEYTALNASIDLSDSQEVKEGLSHLLSERIETLYTQLVQLIGPELSRDFVRVMMKGTKNGNIK